MDEKELPLLTVNILAYNRKEEVRTTLNNIIDHLDYPEEKLEIIVNDNASVDGTSDMIIKEFPQVKLIRIPENKGISGWNYGFVNGRGEYFLVLDDDSHPVEGLKEAIIFMEENKNIGVLACKIIGGAFTTQALTHLQDWVGFIGAGVIIKKDVINKVGGYGDWMFIYAHEWEYGIRVLDAGFDIKYFEKCVVNHRTSKINRSFERLRTYTTRNELAIIYLSFPWGKIPVLLFRTLFWNMLRFRKEGISSAFYPLKGFLLFVKLIPEIKKKRKVVNEEVQNTYTSIFWSTRPVLARLPKKIRSFRI